MRIAMIVSFFFILPYIGKSQGVFTAQINDPVIVTLMDGNKLTGILQDIRSEAIILDLGLAGVITLSKEHISTIDKIEDDARDRALNGEWNDLSSQEIANPLFSKYYITESGIGLQKGESYYQNILLAGHLIAHGITDYFSVAMGLETISIFVGESPGMYVNAKLNTNNSGPLNVGGGMILGLSPSGQDRFGSFYGVATLGNRENNISGGISYFYNWESERQLIYQFGIMVKLNRRLSFILDSGSVPDEDFIFTPALRWKSDIVALDFGVGTDFKNGAIPIAGAAIKF